MSAMRSSDKKKVFKKLLGILQQTHVKMSKQIHRGHKSSCTLVYVTLVLKQGKYEIFINAV